MEDQRLVIERRITLRVYKYWESLCEGRGMPTENDIDPEALGSDWRNCFLLQTRDIEKIEQFNFTYLGESIVQAYLTNGIDPNNLKMVGPNAFCMAQQFMQVIHSRLPLMDEGELAMGNRKILYRQCLLPLGTSKYIEGIFGAMLFRPELKSASDEDVIGKSIW